MIRCLITNGKAREHEPEWLAHVARWMDRSVDYVQIRERDLTARELAELTRKVLALPNPYGTRILVNDRADIAIACGAHGVHLRDGSAAPELFRRPGFLVSAACHSVEEVEQMHGADLILLAPIFTPISKDDNRTPIGLDALRRASLAAKVPLLALGGVTRGNEQACLASGAAGIAGISYFE